MQQLTSRKHRWLMLSATLSIMLLSFILSQGIAFAGTAPSVASLEKHVKPHVTCTSTDNQTIYANYTSIAGPVLFRVGYQSKSGGYGYCHVLAGHPDALPVLAYVLDFGQVVATSPTSVTIKGVWPGNWLTYQIYIVTSNQFMKDGQERGIVSAYPLT